MANNKEIKMNKADTDKALLWRVMTNNRFCVRVIDSRGEVIISENWHSHSSKATTGADVLAGVGFCAGRDREYAVRAVATQVTKLQRICQAVNSHEKLVAVCELIEDTDKPGMTSDARYEAIVAAQQAARAILAKVKKG